MIYIAFILGAIFVGGKLADASMGSDEDYPPVMRAISGGFGFFFGLAVFDSWTAALIGLVAGAAFAPIVWFIIIVWAVVFCYNVYNGIGCNLDLTPDRTQQVVSNSDGPYSPSDVVELDPPDNYYTRDNFSLTPETAVDEPPGKWITTDRDALGDELNIAHPYEIVPEKRAARFHWDGWSVWAKFSETEWTEVLNAHRAKKHIRVRGEIQKRDVTRKKLYISKCEIVN